MDHKDAFRIVKQHLMAQGARSTFVSSNSGASICAYRGEQGLMCAIGALIPDEEYSKNYETVIAAGLRVSTLDGLDINFISRLQTIHDQRPISQWELALDALEADYEL